MPAPSSFKSITQRCPECDYELRGLPHDGLRCPECGCDRGDEPVAPSPPVDRRRAGGRVAILCTLLFILVAPAALLLPLGTVWRCGYRGAGSRHHLRMIQQACIRHAYELGTYPRHVAELVLLGDLDPNEFVEFYETTWTVDVGSVNLLDFDGSPAATEHLRKEIAESRGSGGWYRVGDFWFVNNEGASADPTLIAGWARPDEDGVRAVVFVDAHIESIHERDWKAAWLADAHARANVKEVGYRPSPRPIDPR